MPYYKIRPNKVGIPAEVKTCRVPAVYWSDGWIPTTAVVKLVKNR